MRLKSYFAGAVEAAVAQARQELGEDAMLVYSRDASPETRYLGRYEVVFALPTTAAEESPAALAEPAARPGSPAPASPEIVHALDRIYRETSALRRQLERSIAPLSGAGFAGRQKLVFENLLREDVSPELAREIVASAGEDAGEDAGEEWSGPEQLRRVLREAIGHAVSIESGIAPHSSGAPRTIALVGPAGSGKTTTLVKLAVRYGLQARSPIQLLSIDTQRIAAAEQLRTYAAIIGVGFQVMETPAALAHALEEHRGKSLILIDTAGFGGKEMEAAEEWAHFFAMRPEIDVHLTLSATSKPADLNRVVDRYQMFGPSRLLFTQLDETTTFGTIASQAARLGAPISFLATGQQIPEDLQEATRENVADLILHSSNWIESIFEDRSPAVEHANGGAAAAA
ncbi:MAG: flagellar biosynthesis protein FlhF [Bryobacteraceae bacterium]